MMHASLPLDSSSGAAQAALWASQLAETCAPGPMHLDIAQRTLALDKSLTMQAPFQAQALAQEIWLQTKRLVSEVWFGHGAIEEAGMLYADARAARFLERFGKTGARFAETLRTKAQVRWTETQHASGSIDDAALWRAWIGIEKTAWRLPIINILGLCVWEEVIKPRLADLIGPALSVDVLDTLIADVWQGESNTLAMHRVFRWLVTAAFARSVGTTDVDSLCVEGGFKKLAEKLSRDTGGDGTAIRLALNRLRERTHKAQPFLQYQAVRGAPTEGTQLRIEVGDMLRPGFVSSLPKRSLGQRLARKLVPIPGALLTGVGRANGHAAQSTLQLLVVRELRVKSEELATTGCVLTSDERWRELAKQAGVAAKTIPTIVEAWMTPCDGEPPFLQRQGREGICLSEHHGWATQSILKAQEHEGRGRAARIAANSRHRARLARATG